MQKLFTPNTDNLDSYYNKGKFTLAWRLCLIFSFASFLLSIVFINNSLGETLSYFLCLLFTIFSLFYLYRTRKYKFVYFFLVITGTVITSYTANFINNVLHIGDFLWIILIIAISFFGIGKKFGLIILGIHILNISYYALFTVNDNIQGVVILDFYGRIALMIELIAATFSISYVLVQFLHFHKYTYDNMLNSFKELQEQNVVINRQHNEKAILIKEVHHRVKNNLQIIISLLRLQKNELKTNESKDQFTEAIDRIMVMALIHQKLYQDEALADITVEAYLIDLKNEILKLSEISIPFDVDVKSDIQKVGLKTIVPLGLIVNELISNSIEHAFHDNTTALIKIRLSEKEDEFFELVYSDNGKWKQSGADEPSFGMELIEALASQLEGSFYKKLNENETVFTFILKNLDIEK